MKMSIGIDLGTTNTVVSIGRKGINGNIEVHTEEITQIGEDKITPVSDRLLPSVLYVKDKIPYVGQVAKAMKSQNRLRVISNSKNFIGLPDYSWDIDGIEYTPEVVASHFLKSARNFLHNKYIDGKALESAVITVPASFDIDQKRATRTAAQLAGFEESKITLISEPTAAMLDFINEQRQFTDESKTLDFSTGRNVLVFDLGGGTCDVAILNIKISEDTVNVEEMAVSPHTLIGGGHFDTYAVLGIIREYNNLHEIDLEKQLTENDFKELKNQLSIRCEKAKLFFSGRYENIKNLTEIEREKIVEGFKFPISVPNILNGKAFMYELTMKKYNEFIKPLLNNNSSYSENIIEPIEKTIVDANLEIEEIDDIFCVGGMTMYPNVTNTLRNYFKKEPLTALNRMHSVSRGAAVFHYYKVNIVDKKEKGNMAIDVIPKMPQSIFLNVKDGFPILLIKAKTEVGTPIVLEKIIKVHSEICVELELYGGRNIFDPELKKLKNAKLEFPHGVEKGSPISLKVEYTDSGILNFEAWITNNPNIKIDVCLDDLFMNNQQIENVIKDYKLDEIKGVF